MIGMTQKIRLVDIEDALVSMYADMKDGYIEDDLIQTAVDIQVTVNRMVWLLNKTYYGEQESEDE